MSVETCADAVLVFSCPQSVCELDPCLWKRMLMLSLSLSCPQLVCCLFLPSLTTLLIMFYPCSALRMFVNLLHDQGVSCSHRHVLCCLIRLSVHLFHSSAIMLLTYLSLITGCLLLCSVPGSSFLTCVLFYCRECVFLSYCCTFSN